MLHSFVLWFLTAPEGGTLGLSILYFPFFLTAAAYALYFFSPFSLSFFTGGASLLHSSAHRQAGALPQGDACRGRESESQLGHIHTVYIYTEEKREL